MTDAEIVAARLKGEKLVDIAARDGRHISTISQIAVAGGVPRGPGGKRVGYRFDSSAWHDVAAIMRESGMTLRSIGSMFGVTPEAVFVALKRRSARP